MQKLPFSDLGSNAMVSIGYHMLLHLSVTTKRQIYIVLEIEIKRDREE